MYYQKVSSILMKEEAKSFVEIFADGACSGNPGIGGYGAILKSGKREKELSGCEPLTTNNRMELTAVIKAIEALKISCRVRVNTDSSYVVHGMNSWINKWLKRKWKNSKNQKVANKDLWEKLIKLSKQHEIEWEWIKGHNSHIENERCDKLARRAIQNCKKKIKDKS